MRPARRELGLRWGFYWGRFSSTADFAGSIPVHRISVKRHRIAKRFRAMAGSLANPSRWGYRSQNCRGLLAGDRRGFGGSAAKRDW